MATEKNKLVRLILPEPIHLTPTPDKAPSMSFAQTLRRSGTTGSIAVRPRMITIIGRTKFKTLSGLPVSLVGLHGKGELLVVGPDWAIERLSDGDAVPSSASDGEMTALQRVKDVVHSEYQHALMLPDLLRSVGVTVGGGVDGKAPHPVHVAQEMLQAFFRASLEAIRSFFVANDPAATCEQFASEAADLLSVIDKRLETTDDYPIWWEPWTGASPRDYDFLLRTSSGRHVCVYPVSVAALTEGRSTRHVSLATRWQELLENEAQRS